jgi:plasmid stabilization system protein ParE
MITDYDEFEALSEQDKSEARPITDPSELVSPEAVAQYAHDWLSATKLNENQAVFSMLGSDGIIQPRLSDEAGRGRLIDTGDLEASARLAVYALNYLPNRQKIRPPGLNDTQWNMALHLMNQAAGGGVVSTGLIDIAASNGIDLTTATGQGELEAELEGRESAFDAIQLVLSETQYQGILAYVRTIEAGSAASLGRQVFYAWKEEADLALEAMVAHHMLAVTLSTFLDVRDPFNENETARADYVRNLGDSMTVLISSGRKATEHSELLEGMLASSEVVALDSIRTVVPGGGDSTAAMATWVTRERSFGERVGTLIQYLLYGRQGEDAARRALDSLRSELSDIALEAETQRQRAEIVYESVGEEISWLLESPEKPRESRTRPAWIRG